MCLSHQRLDNLDMEKMRTVGLVIGFLIVSSTAFGKDICTENMEQLTAAIASASAGDRIVMANGIWRDAQIVFSGTGTADQPITIIAETPGQVVLTGESQLQIAGKYLVVDGLWFKEGALKSGHIVQFRGQAGATQNCRLTNTAITDYNPPDKKIDYRWVSLYGQNNRVDHCYFRGQTHAGVTVTVWVENEPNDHVIDHNYFAGRPPLGRNGGETIRVGTSDVSMTESRTVVEYNLFEHCDGELEIISNKSCGNMYCYNTFRASKGMLTLRHGNGCLVEGNFFFGDGVEKTGGVRIIGEDHVVVNNYFEGLLGTGGNSALVIVDGIPNSKLNEYFQVKRALIAFNTFVNCRQVFEIGNVKGERGRMLTPEDVVIANNLVCVSQTDRPIVTLVDTLFNGKWEGNLFYGGDIGIESTGIFVADPQLEQVDGLYRLGEKSPAIDLATGDYSNIVWDLDGQNRAGKKDVGCDEWSTEKVQNRPVTKGDVGPVWMR